MACPTPRPTWPPDQVGRTAGNLSPAVFFADARGVSVRTTIASRRDESVNAAFFKIRPLVDIETPKGADVVANLIPGPDAVHARDSRRRERALSHPDYRTPTAPLPHPLMPRKASI